MLSPSIDRVASIIQALEQMHVQTVIPELAAELRLPRYMDRSLTPGTAPAPRPWPCLMLLQNAAVCSSVNRLRFVSGRPVSQNIAKSDVAHGPDYGGEVNRFQYIH